MSKQQVGAIFAGNPNVSGETLDEVYIITNADGETQDTELSIKNLTSLQQVTDVGASTTHDILIKHSGAARLMVYNEDDQGVELIGGFGNAYFNNSGVNSHFFANPNGIALEIHKSLRSIFGGVSDFGESQDSLVTANRNWAATGSNLYAHAFADVSTLIGFSNTSAYGTFDSRTRINGSAGFEHYVSFQALPHLLNSFLGTVNRLVGHGSSANINGGTVNQVIDYNVDDLNISGGATVVIRKVFNVPTLISGNEIFAHYVESNKSYFGGKTGIGVDPTAGADKLQVVGGTITDKLKITNGDRGLIIHGVSSKQSVQLYDLTLDANAYSGLGTDMGANPYETSIIFAKGAMGTPGRLTIGSYNGTVYSTKVSVLENGDVNFVGSLKTTAPNDGNANTFVKNTDVGVNDPTSTPYTKSTINSVYPNAKFGFRVVCENNAVGATYIKIDNSATGNWDVQPLNLLT